MKEIIYKDYAELPLMLSVPDIAAILGISRTSAYELVRSQGFPSLSVGNRIIIPKDRFIVWVNKSVSSNVMNKNKKPDDVE